MKKEDENIVIGEYRNGKLYCFPDDSVIIGRRKVEEDKLEKFLPLLGSLGAGVMLIALMLSWYYGLFF